MYVSGMRHLYNCVADVLRIAEITNDEGFVTGLTYQKVESVIDTIHGVAGELPCRTDLTIVRKGSKAALQAAQGKAIGRSGTLVCDVTENLYAGDRLAMRAGSATIGIFEIKARPDILASPFGNAAHLEVDVLEVTKPGSKAAGTFTPQALIATQSGVRHWFNTHVEVYRKTSAGTYSKTSDIVDTILGIPGELMCNIAIGAIMSNPAAPLPIPAGRAPDRTGVLMCDPTQYLLADDRLKVISGPNTGIFEVRQTPDLISGYAEAQHLEVEVVELTRTLNVEI